MFVKPTYYELIVSLLPDRGIEIGWRVLAAGMSFAKSSKLQAGNLLIGQTGNLINLIGARWNEEINI